MSATRLADARYIDHDRRVLHLPHPRRGDVTRCRREMGRMWPSYNGEYWRHRDYGDCEACRELVNRERRLGVQLP
jgi:hypothetical protein